MADQPKKDTLTPLYGCGNRGVGIVENEHGSKLVEVVIPKEGQPANGMDLYMRGSDGTFEKVSTGPAQVATKAYREGWEATFGKNGGVS